MADASNQKKGLTTFGWLLIGGAAAAVFSSKERRQKVTDAVRGWGGKAPSNGSEGSSAG